MVSKSEGAEPTVRVGLVGAGQVGARHCQAFARLGPGVRVVGVADVIEYRARQLAEIHETRAFTDYRNLLELTPDIAVICLPHHLHREVGLAAAEAGSHVLMEKPLANTLEDAHAILNACREHDVRLAVGFVHRYRTEFRQAKQLIANGEAGRVTMISDFFSIPGGDYAPSWVWQEEHSGGGVLMYSGIHSIDWQCWLVGSDVKEVFSRTTTHSQRSGVETGLAATMAFDNGCVGTLVGDQPAYSITSPIRDTVISGSRARLWIRKGEYLDFSAEGQAFRTKVVCDDPFAKQARDFVTAVREERVPWISGEKGLRALAVVQAIYRSAKLGEPVTVSEIA